MYKFETNEIYYNKINSNTYIEKSAEEKLKDGLITAEEYNIIIKEKRENLYKNKTDKQVMELTRLFLNRNINNMTEEEKALLDDINSTVASIKQELPKQN
ncbi:hypothetical protein BFL38_09890 [Brachyspira hampsonii]|uniref:Uncharacterized protein n=1 Tax=Brachyspira hampsonii TaxID=1287055 RepID=A0A1E5NHX8_9SPIR|nr:hypothetical protein [Brachyspira hampsonii]OEJ15765.1 hypothetical protein BFL38_09890 [Brachyspira hampsonii]